MKRTYFLTIKDGKTIRITQKQYDILRLEKCRGKYILDSEAIRETITIYNNMELRKTEVKKGYDYQGSFMASGR